MTETHTVHDPFLGQDVEISDALVDRLRGKYACGPTLPNGEPEFGWRKHETAPIQHEAAVEIERLRKALTQIEQISDNAITANALDAFNALSGIRNIIKSKNPGAGGPLSAPDVAGAPQSSRQEPAPSGCPSGAGSLSFAEDGA